MTQAKPRRPRWVAFQADRPSYFARFSKTLRDSRIASLKSLGSTLPSGLSVRMSCQRSARSRTFMADQTMHSDRPPKVHLWLKGEVPASLIDVRSSPYYQRSGRQNADARFWRCAQAFARRMRRIGAPRPPVYQAEPPRILYLRPALLRTLTASLCLTGP